MERHQRRALLDTAPNPDGSIDYVTGVEGAFGFDEDGTRASVILRYVPDRRILKPETVEDYLSALDGSQWETVEEVAVTLLSDLRNELVARRLQVTVKMELPSLERVDGQGITMEDRQPNWSNDALLDRLPPV